MDHWWPAILYWTTLEGLTYVISCEHASREVPASLSRLGLDEAVLASHVAWDPGAKEVATEIARALDAPLFLGDYSRLVADLNRSPTSPEVVPEIAFGVVVPGNQRLSQDARSDRIAKYHTAYQSAVKEAIRARLPPNGGTPRVLHLSVHSFVGVLHGKERDLDLGILFDPAHALEARIARALLPRLAGAGFDARSNEPYDGRSDGFTTLCRALFPEQHYAGVEIEISQRLLGELDRVAAALVRCLSMLGGSER